MMAMAGRIWTKGVAWKKAAVNLLAESHYASGNLTSLDPCCQKVSMSGQWSLHSNASSFTPISNQFSKDNIAFKGSSFSSIQDLSTYQGNPFASSKRSQGCLLQTSGGNLSGNCDSFNQLRIAPKSSIRSHIGRWYSTTNSNNDISDTPKTDAQKVGIISSMFPEEAKSEQSKEQPEKQREQDKKEEQGEKTENPFLRSQKVAKWMLIGTFAVGTPLFVWEFGPPKRDEMGNIIPDDFSNDPPPLAYTKRAWNEVILMKKDIVEPSSQKLLPDPMQAPYYQPPYTLVIELFDVLLHPVYDQIHGWRFKKRPGIDYFLEQVGPPLYEIVIFTREVGMTAYPLIDSMDPKGYIMYRLFRDAARFKSGFKLGNMTKGEWPKLDPYYQKDLTYLNRDLKRVVVVDNDKRATELQPSNGISLKPWDGTSTDTELFDLAAFLRTIATNEVDDVRPVLEHYRKYEDPLAAFKLAQIRMHEEQQKLAKELQENKGKPYLLNSKGGSGGFSMLTNFFKSRN